MLVISLPKLPTEVAVGTAEPVIPRDADQRPRGVFVADGSRHILYRSSVRNFFSYVLEALIEAAMTYGFSGSGHVGAMLSRFGADHRIERERLETMVATKLVHLLLHTIDEIRLLLLFGRRRIGSHLAEVRRFQVQQGLGSPV
jgi:hypothetical protein